MELYEGPPSLMTLAMSICTSTQNSQIISSCSECAKSSRSGFLRKYFVNLEETIVTCDNEKCTYISEKPPDPDVSAFETDADLTNFLDSLLTDSNIDLTLDEHNKPSDSIFKGLGSEATPIAATPTAAGNNSAPGVIAASSTIASEYLSYTHNTPSLSQVVDPYPCTAVWGNSTATPHSPVTCIRDYVMLWSNVDALCWLDVLLCMLCYNHSIRQLSPSLPYSCVVKKLLLAFDESQALIAPLQKGESNILHSLLEFDRNQPAVKIGGGYCMPTTSSNSILANISNCQALSSQEVNNAKRKIHLAGIKLECVREEIWQSVEQKLNCERGKKFSPVFALPAIVESESSVSGLFYTEYEWSVSCMVCHHRSVSRNANHIITFPQLTDKFDIQSGAMIHKYTCPKCLAPGQARQLCISKYAPNLVMHFTEGQGLCNINKLNFTSPSGSRYVVTSVVEHTTSPDHFTVWTRQLHSAGEWMCYDDMKSQYSQFNIQKEELPSPNIHLVLWESLPSATCAVASPPVNNVYNQTELIPPITSSITSSAPIGNQLKETSSASSVKVTKKSIPLLTPKITSKQPSERPPYGSGLSGRGLAAHSSYSDIIGSLSKVSATSASLSVANKSASTPQLSTPKSNPQANKSYLDLVKPLLQKNKEQNGRLLTGYVPKSMRNKKSEASPEKSKRKKVMFTLSDAQKKPAVGKKVKTPVHLVKQEVQTTPMQTPPRAKKLARASTLVSNFVYNSTVSNTSSSSAQCSEDMPSLDDMLNGL